MKIKNYTRIKMHEFFGVLGHGGHIHTGGVHAGVVVKPVLNFGAMAQVFGYIPLFADPPIVAEPPPRHRSKQAWL